MLELRCLDCNKDGISRAVASNHRNLGHKVFWVNTETGELFERKPGTGNRLYGEPGGNGHDKDLELGDIVKPGSGTKPPRTKTPVVVKDSITVTPEELSAVVFTKKSVEVVLPQIILVAKEACEKEWGWPAMNISDWLATFCYIMMKKKGIVLGHYSVMERSNHD